MTSQKKSYSTTTNTVETIRNEATIFDLAHKSSPDLKVVITSSPGQSSIEHFVEFMIEEGITDIFNFCHPDAEKTPYDSKNLNQNGINVHRIAIDDGSSPKPLILGEFNLIIDDILNKLLDSEPKKGAILFHCEAGLGRAPTMLAYLMMTRYGWNNKRLDMISEIRAKRRSAINIGQLKWIQNVDIKKVSNKQRKCIIL